MSERVSTTTRLADATKLAAEQYDAEDIASLGIWSREYWIKTRAQALVDHGAALAAHDAAIRASRGEGL
jgi:hypothetical protein